MTDVIVRPCVDVMDKPCVKDCPVDCIYEGPRMLDIQPDVCMDCVSATGLPCPGDLHRHRGARTVGWLHGDQRRALRRLGLTGRCLLADRTGRDIRVGTVGPLLHGVDVRIAADGEMLVRAPNVTSGSFKGPEGHGIAPRRRGLDGSGDVGQLDSDDYPSGTSLHTSPAMVIEWNQRTARPPARRGAA